MIATHHWMGLNDDSGLNFHDARFAASSFNSSFRAFAFAFQKTVFDMATGVMIGGALSEVAKRIVVDSLTPLLDCPPPPPSNCLLSYSELHYPVAC